MERKPRLLEQVRQKIRLLHYSIRTEQSYVHWIKRFILFHGKRHPLELGAVEIEAFLTTLATERKARALRARLDGRHWLVAALLYGSGLRLLECARLRVKDLDFERRAVLVRDGVEPRWRAMARGRKDRITIRPDELLEPLRQHLVRTREIHLRDIQESFSSVYLPYAIARKYSVQHNPQQVALAAQLPPTKRAGATSPGPECHRNLRPAQPSSALDNSGTASNRSATKP